MKTSMFACHVKRVGRYLISGLLLMMLFQSVALAQFSSLNNGDRVRIFAPDIRSKMIEGDIFHITSSEIFLNSQGYDVIIPFNLIDRMDISTGTKRNTGKGALIGLTGGALVGSLVGLASYRDCDSDEFMGCFLHFSQGESALLGAAVGGLVGLVAGTVIGTVTKTYRWERLPLEVSMDFQSVPEQKLSFSPVLSVKFSLSGQR